MSHSTRRATARIDCRGVCVKRLVNGLGAWHKHRYNANCVRLRAAFKNESIEQQQDHGADDRHDPASDIITARKDATDPGPYQCAGDAEQNRDDATTGISSRHQQLCDRTDDQSDE